MKPKRLIIHMEGVDSLAVALTRIAHAIPKYYEYKGESDRRLTVRFLEDNHMVIYHDKTDMVIFYYGG